MKKVLKIILGVLLAGITALTVWQWDSIKTLWVTVNDDPETLAQKVADTEKSLREKLEVLLSRAPRGHDDPRESQVPEPSADPDPGKDGPVSKPTESPTVEVTPAPEPTEEPEPDETAARYARIEEIVNEIYTLRDSCVSRIDAIRADALSSFRALPPEELTPDNKARIVFSFAGELEALESSCDARMEALVTELRGLLADLGEDQSIADEVVDLYFESKEAKKADLIYEYVNGSPD